MLISRYSGHGSFGIIRKVKRKTDGKVFSTDLDRAQHALTWSLDTMPKRNPIPANVYEGEGAAPCRVLNS